LKEKSESVAGTKIHETRLKGCRSERSESRHNKKKKQTHETEKKKKLKDCTNAHPPAGPCLAVLADELPTA